MLTAAAHAADIPAFPGAEGFGAKATGGRGGEVYEVTNLNDAGPGSLRDAVSKPNRTVVFRVSGTIDLDSRLEIKEPNLTIAGQTAPGEGITLRKHELFIKNTNNIIVRYIRSRPGDEAKVELDAVTVWGSGDVILDHCSMSWSTDSLNDVVKESGNVTVQWCILSEPLNNSVHVKGAHGYATGWDGRTRGGGSFHHNLIAHAASRAPRIGYNKIGRGTIDCRNNVIYDSGPAYGAEGDDLNFVGNYYRPGPHNFRPDGAIFHISADTAKAYFAGNVFEGRDKVLGDNLSAVTQHPVAAMYVPKLGEDAPTTKPADVSGNDLSGASIAAKPFDMAPVATQSADEAYKLVLASAGASHQRDAVDERILADVRNRTGGLVNSQNDVGGWPELKSTTPPADSDHDGIPDDWEKRNGLNPNDPADGREIAKDGYSNLEHYLNSLVK
jgi:pectate lyase